MRLSKESEAADLSVNGVRTTQSVLWPYIPQTEMSVHCCPLELGSGMWGLDSNPRERTAVDFREMAEGMKGRRYTTRNAFEKKPSGHGSRALLLSHTQG